MANVKKKYEFKRRLKAEKIFYRRIFSFMAETEDTAGERAELYRSIAEEAERRNTSNKSVCEEGK